mmetsp:Transcript_92295/g.238220  ORF Transcript_92295/g.238220 Transcript_92295/m.238220 type:complete len:218 (+) Transcript_92295:106-759(+)
MLIILAFESGWPWKPIFTPVLFMTCMDLFWRAMAIGPGTALLSTNPRGSWVMKLGMSSMTRVTISLPPLPSSSPPPHPMSMPILFMPQPPMPQPPMPMGPPMQPPMPGTQPPPMPGMQPPMPPIPARPMPPIPVWLMPPIPVWPMPPMPMSLLGGGGAGVSPFGFSLDGERRRLRERLRLGDLLGEGLRRERDRLLRDRDFERSFFSFASVRAGMPC